MADSGPPEQQSIANECGYSVPVHILEFALARAKVSVCHVKLPDISATEFGDEGSGAFYEFVDDNFCFMTNNHVLPNVNRSFVSQVILTFAAIGSVSLSEDEIKYVTTNTSLDATVVEFTDQCVRRLNQRGVNFIRVTSGHPGKQIAMAQYPDGVFSFDKGHIREIKDNDIYYSLGGGPGSSGSPLLLWDFRAVGIHRGRGENSGDIDLGYKRVGTNMSSIVVNHLNETRKYIRYTTKFPLTRAAPNPDSDSAGFGNFFLIRYRIRALPNAESIVSTSFSASTNTLFLQKQLIVMLVIS